MMGSRSLVALILVACMHRPPATPSPAVAPAVSVAEGESTELSQPVIRGFVDIEEHCHWVHLDAATGEVLRSRPLPTQNCPNRAIVNTSTAGTTLMAVHFAEHNELWLQRGANAEIMEIVGDPHLEMAWEASGRVYATTVDFKMGHVVEWPDLNTVSTMPIDEEREADNHRDCYTYAWSEGPTTSEPTWELIREETIERSEESMSPHCPVGDLPWSTTRNDYAEYAFHALADAQQPHGDVAPGYTWGIVTDIDATRSGPPCFPDCDEDELLRRYAFAHMWLGGPVLGGGAMAWDGQTWANIEGLQSNVQEFLLAGDQLILCTDDGFGAWDHATATPIWWKDSWTCPLQMRRAFRGR